MFWHCMALEVELISIGDSCNTKQSIYLYLDHNFGGRIPGQSVANYSKRRQHVFSCRVFQRNDRIAF